MKYYHNLNPVIFELFGFEIRWYGLMYILGFIACYFLIQKLVETRKVNLKKENVYDMIIYAGFGLLIGGRFLYFVFYNLGGLIDDPLSLFMVWKGGMSFHGGLIGILIAGIFFCRKYKISYLAAGDLVVIPVGIALFLGRVGNFINGELYGRLVSADFPLCIDYSQNDYMLNKPAGCRYPSQLFEAAKNLVIFATLWSLRKKKYRDGTYVSLFLMMYGVLRFLIEFVRQPDADPGFVISIFTMGQVLCFFMIVGGIGLLGYIYKDKAPINRIINLFSGKRAGKE